jgi:molybdenum cofactor cytidylyltransferase
MVVDRRVAAIVLAAGESRRFGSPKQLAVVDGRSLLEHAVETAAHAGLVPIVAVVPAWLPRPERLDAGWLRWVRNPFPERGMSHSLQLGLDAVPEDAEAVVILLGDQPRVPSETIAAVLAARGELPIVAAEAGGVAAPPVLVERAQFELVRGLTGDRGLRDVLRDQPHLVRAVPVARHATDVDAPADLDLVRDHAQLSDAHPMRATAKQPRESDRDLP